MCVKASIFDKRTHVWMSMLCFLSICVTNRIVWIKKYE